MALKLKFIGGEPAKLTAKAVETGGAVIVSGYASTFGNVDAYGDIIRPGAFAKTLADRDWPVQMFHNHRLGAIGKWTSFAEDARGLRVVGELTPGHALASDVAASIRHGATAGLSIGFAIPKGGAVSRDPENDPEGWRGLVISKIDLYELSVVDMPANVMAEIDDVRDFHAEAFRRDVDAAGTLADLERSVRRHFGIPRRDAHDLSERFKRLVSSELDAVRAELDGVKTHGDMWAALRDLEGLVRQ